MIPMSEGQPLDVASNPPREVPRSDILSFESEQERSPEPQQQLQEPRLGREERQVLQLLQQLQPLLSQSELQRLSELLQPLPELLQHQPELLQPQWERLLQLPPSKIVKQLQPLWQPELIPQLELQLVQPQELQVLQPPELQKWSLLELLQQPELLLQLPLELLPSELLLQLPPPELELLLQLRQQPEPLSQELRGKLGELRGKLRELLQQSQPQELYQQPQHQQRYYLNFQRLVTAVQCIGLHRFRLCGSPYYEALSSFKLFLSDTLSMVTGANEITRGFLFLGTNGVVIHQLATVNSFTFEKRNLLSFEEAFSMSLPPMVHISMILLSLALNFVLLFRVYPGIQCVLLLLCILMPLYYFAELAHEAAGIAVNLGRSYKMPLIWFSTFGGLGISLIGGSMVLLIVFLSWLYARRRGLEFQGIRVNGDAIIGAMNA